MEILWHYEDGKYAIFGVKQMHTKKITEVAVTKHRIKQFNSIEDLANQANNK